MVTENEEVKKETQTEQVKNAPASSPEQQQAKEQIEKKVEHLDNIVKAGEQIEKETKGENPDWKGVKDVHAGKAPIDKVLYENENQTSNKVETQAQETVKQVPEAPKVDTGPRFRSSAVNEWVKGSTSKYNK